MYIAAGVLPFASGTGSAVKGVVMDLVEAEEKADALSAIALVEKLGKLAIEPGAKRSDAERSGVEWSEVALNCPGIRDRGLLVLGLDANTLSSGIDHLVIRIRILCSFRNRSSDSCLPRQRGE